MIETKREKVWEEKYTFGEEDRDALIRQMAREIGVSEYFAVLLYNRGYRSTEEAESFLRLESSSLHDPYLMADMDKAVERILSAVENREKICIYGDYDVDGVTSVTALYLYLTGQGAQVEIKIPKREGEGYGVTVAAIDKLRASGVQLIITVDTGITATEEVAYAKRLGIDFVITDHHECKAELPDACAVVNPHRPDCQYPFKELAGVGVVYKVLCACEMKKSRDMGELPVCGIRRVCYEYSDLTAIGTIADVMPVVDENRLIVTLGLKTMQSTKRPGLKALINACPSRKNSDQTPKITAGLIGFGLAPRINAAGRISDATIAVSLLLEQDEERAAQIAEELCEINRRRQNEENRIAVEAYEQIEDSCDLNLEKVIVLESDRWKQGIIGIVASRITEQYGLPTILVSFDGCNGDFDPWDDGKGSGRSIKGMNLVEALRYCDDLLVKYGGHELAAGLTVKRGNLDAFRDKINEYAKQCLTEDDFRIHLEADCAISMKDITIKLAREIGLLEPFGIGNATPTFTMKDVKVKKVTSIGSGKHTRLLVEREGVCMTALFFGVGESSLGFEAGDIIDIMFSLDINEYKNVRSVQLILQDARMAESYVKELAHWKERYAQISEGDSYRMEENVLPNRDDFARVYKTLRWQYRTGLSYVKLKELIKLVNEDPNELPIGYVKMKFILRILNELNICTVEDFGKDSYQISVCFNASKTSIDKSSILKKLRTQCVDRPR